MWVRYNAQYAGCFYDPSSSELYQLKEKYPANLIVVTGELTIDLPDKIDNYATNQKRFKLSSNRLTFNNCLLENAIAVLNDQYAISCTRREAARDWANSGDRLTEKIIDTEIEKDETVRERMATHTRIK